MKKLYKKGENVEYGNNAKTNSCLDNRNLYKSFIQVVDRFCNVTLTIHSRKNGRMIWLSINMHNKVKDRNFKVL